MKAISLVGAASLAALVAVAAQVRGAPIPTNLGEQTVNLGGTMMTIFTYRPSACPNPSLLLVFHGQARNAAGYRNNARDLADRNCMVVVTPLFDRDRFPSSVYQRGGIVKRGIVQDRRDWTVHLVTDLVNWARREVPTGNYYLFGHSAGAQFLSRVAAFLPLEARRIVIANPSTHVFPSLQVDAPYGLGGVYAGAQREAQLRRYLAQPVTIFLGEDDTGESDENLSRTPQAMAQGRTRHERGLNVFAAGKELAARRNWTFSWRLVEASQVGHSARGMLTAPEMLDALRP